MSDAASAPAPLHVLYRLPSWEPVSSTVWSTVSEPVLKCAASWTKCSKLIPRCSSNGVRMSLSRSSARVLPRQSAGIFASSDPNVSNSFSAGAAASKISSDVFVPLLPPPSAAAGGLAPSSLALPSSTAFFSWSSL